MSISPLEDARLVTNSLIRFEVTASAVDGTITKVKFYEGDPLIRVATNSPYRVDWTAPSPRRLPTTPVRSEATFHRVLVVQ